MEKRYEVKVKRNKEKNNKEINQSSLYPIWPSKMKTVLLLCYIIEKISN